MIVNPTSGNVARSAEVLRSGGLVIMPTETVYGLAADALNEVAVRSVFAAKARPAENPLIVHGASVDALKQVTSVWPVAANLLAAEFWPGPLTLVLPRASVVPDVTTAGLDSVAVRIPAHPVALQLLAEFGGVVAAPSANRFMSLSPTRAEDVDASLLGPEGLILDGGACKVGIESTVLDLSGPIPRVLRRGHILPDQIEAVLGRPVEVGSGDGPRKAPGQYPRHYAPSVPVRIVDSLDGVNGVPRIDDPLDYARYLYAKVKALETAGETEILIERPPEGPEWAAAWDRLQKMQG